MTQIKYLSILIDIKSQWSFIEDGDTLLLNKSEKSFHCIILKNLFWLLYSLWDHFQWILKINFSSDKNKRSQI